MSIIAFVFPAPAGMNRFIQLRPTQQQSVPRTRGDEPDPQVS